MSVFAKAATSRSRKAVITGIALIGASALVLSGCAASTTDEPAGPVEDYTLGIGTLLPQTGNLAFLGPPEEAGVAMAVAEVNDAAADTGLTLDVTYGDSGDTDNKAYETEAPRILAEGVSAIIGAASSGTSLQFIDQVVGEGVIQFSPANTSDAFTTYDDNGLYFRTAPSDVLQGEVLGNLIAEDGNQTLGMIVLNDSYGTGLAKYVTEAFEAAGGEVVAAPTYNTGDSNFDAQISEVLAAAPDAIAWITFAEISTILPSLFGQVAPEQLYFVDGNLSNFGRRVSPPVRSPAPRERSRDCRSTRSATSRANSTHSWRRPVAPLEDYSYAAESYDAVILLALASLAAGGATEGADIAAKLQEVSGGSGDGEKCSTYAECAAIILDGGVADYDGISGPITFDKVGDPTEASIGIYVYGEDNNYVAY